MAEYPLKILEQLDPQLLKLVQQTSSLALEEGALPKKIKLLIAMALDAAHGTVPGVKSLASQALQAGATREEIMEALRVAFHIAGAGSVYTAANALREIF